MLVARTAAEDRAVSALGTAAAAGGLWALGVWACGSLARAQVAAAVVLALAVYPQVRGDISSYFVYSVDMFVHDLGRSRRLVAGATWALAAALVGCHWAAYAGAGWQWV